MNYRDEKGREMVYLDVEVDNGCYNCLESDGKTESDVQREYEEGRKADSSYVRSLYRTRGRREVDGVSRFSFQFQ